jgi:hypothetical protein
VPRHTGNYDDWHRARNEGKDAIWVVLAGVVLDYTRKRISGWNAATQEESLQPDCFRVADLSFVTQGCDGLDARGAVTRNGTGRRCNEREEKRDRKKSERVSGADAINKFR